MIAQVPVAAVVCVRQDLYFWLGWPNEISVHQHF
jgi:hypothetical protein